MLFIRIILFITATLILLYPIWGIIAPDSYLNELLDKFPFAIGASEAQIQQSSLILLIPSFFISISFVFIAKFMSNPKSYIYAKLAAIALVISPLLQSICEVFIGRILSQHLLDTQDASISVGLSSISFLYILFGLVVWGISKSQYEHNKHSSNDI